MATEKETGEEHLWERGWDGHEQAQLRRLARLPFSEKLRWLEDAQHFVRQVAESRKRQVQGSSSGSP
ncbi:MAG: hypothetical protein PHU25_15425 [Deltaproteobacteria bacterium]|nr:hypothetical protein [Deltaproteobacteria bacterium]